jgi:hypothetical protein
MADTSLEDTTAVLSTDLAMEDDDSHRVVLLDQFYLTLSVTYSAAGPPAVPSALHDRIDRLFAAAQSWRNAYEIEQLLCFVMTEHQLETELNRRLAEAKVLKLEFVDTVDLELHDDGGKLTTPDKRFVLHRLLNDLQWFYMKRIQHRTAGKRLMQRVSLLFVGALVTMFLVLFIQFFAQARAVGPARGGGPAGTPASPAAAPAPSPAPPAADGGQNPGGPVPIVRPPA